MKWTGHETGNIFYIILPIRLPYILFNNFSLYRILMSQLYSGLSRFYPPNTLHQTNDHQLTPSDTTQSIKDHHFLYAMIVYPLYPRIDNCHKTEALCHPSLIPQGWGVPEPKSLAGSRTEDNAMQKMIRSV